MFTLTPRITISVALSSSVHGPLTFGVLSDEIAVTLYPFARGPQGPQGAQGIQGNVGQQGGIGPQGSPGAQGQQGQQGIQGNTGSQGNTGPQGNTGLQGAQGAQGIQGVPGPIGDSYEHVQSAGSVEWIINHNFGRNPIIDILSPGGLSVVAEVQHLTLNQTRAFFNLPQTGKAIAR